MTKSDIIKTLSLKHMYFNKTIGKYTYQPARVVDEAQRTYQANITREDITITLTKDVREQLATLKENGERYVAKEVKENDDGTFVNEGEKTIKTMSAKARGEQQLEVLIWLSPDVEKTPEYIQEVLGYPMERWAITNHSISLWGTGYNVEGKELHNYAIKVGFKPKTSEDLGKEDFKNILESMTIPKIPNLKNKKISKNTNGQALVWHITDVHFGSAYSKGEHLGSVAEEIVLRYQNHGYDKFIFALTGDLLHADNSHETTHRGTQLKLVGSVYDMYRYAIDNLEKAIATIGKHFDCVEVYWTQGNHSRDMEWAMMNNLSDRFMLSPHITFDVDERLFKAVEYHKCLIGLTHGDIKEARKTLWLAHDFSEAWGRTTEHEILTGHFHKEYVSIDEVSGITLRIGRALKSRDEYEYSQGYTAKRPLTHLHTYDKELGHIGEVKL